MSLENLSFKLPAELKARFEAEAENLGRSRSEHAREVLTEHFEGQSVDRVKEHLAELTEAVHELRDEAPGAGDQAQHSELLRAEVEQLRGTVEALTATVHHALRIIVFQQLRPTNEQFQELEAAFETLRLRYKRG